MEKYVENLQYLSDKGIEHTFINFDVLGGETRKEISSGQICKTLVLIGELSGVIILAIPIEKKADLRKVRLFLNDKKVKLSNDVQRVSGYEHGANGPLPIHKDHPEYTYLFDKSLLGYSQLVSNIGKYAHTVLTDTTVLIDSVNGRVSDFIKE